MPEVYVLQPTENHRDRRQSPTENRHDHHQTPTNLDNDRYTPVPYGKSNEQKPELYHIGTKNDKEPMHDERPFKPSSPPINSSYRSSGSGPELYHLKVADDNDIPDRRPSPAFVSSNRVSPMPHQTSNRQGPEMYYLQVADDNDIPDRRPSPAFVSSNRVSPMPHQTSNRQGPEMYYLQVGDESRRQSPPINKTKFNDTTTHSDNLDQEKVTMYMLTTTDQENQSPSPRIQRTPSPPIRPAKRQQPVSYDINDNNNKYDISNKQRPFPTALHDVPTSIRYVPLTQSKASESIQRSMNKYRFGGS